MPLYTLVQEFLELKGQRRQIMNTCGSLEPENWTQEYYKEISLWGHVPWWFLEGYAALSFSPLLSSCEVGQASSGKVIGVRMLGQATSPARLCVPKRSLTITNLPSFQHQMCCRGHLNFRDVFQNKLWACFLNDQLCPRWARCWVVLRSQQTCPPPPKFIWPLHSPCGL